MIDPFCLHEGSKDTAQAEAMKKAHPWKITDQELNNFEEKVKPQRWTRNGEKLLSCNEWSVSLFFFIKPLLFLTDQPPDATQ